MQRNAIQCNVMLCYVVLCFVMLCMYVCVYVYMLTYAHVNDSIIYIIMYMYILDDMKNIIYGDVGSICGQVSTISRSFDVFV